MVTSSLYNFNDVHQHSYGVLLMVYIFIKGFEFSSLEEVLQKNFNSGNLLI